MRIETQLMQHLAADTAPGTDLITRILTPVEYRGAMRPGCQPACVPLTFKQVRHVHRSSTHPVPLYQHGKREGGMTTGHGCTQGV